MLNAHEPSSCHEIYQILLLFQRLKKTFICTLSTVAWSAIIAVAAELKELITPWRVRSETIITMMQATCTVTGGESLSVCAI